MFRLRALFSVWLVLVLLNHRILRASAAKRPEISGGEFSTSDRTQCTWSAGEAGDAVKVRLSCVSPGAQRPGRITATSCEYLGRPRSCPGYNQNPRTFWKQVARAFKKLQNKVCVDGRALVKAGLCRRAPREVHLRLDPRSVRRGPVDPTTLPPLRPTSPACATRAERRRAAEDVCSSAWASVCAFFMSMLQSEDC